MDTVKNINPNVAWNLITEETFNGMKIKNLDNIHINFTVPRGEVADIVLIGCFILSFTGDSTVIAKLRKNEVEAWYNCLEVQTFLSRNAPKTKDDHRDKL